MPYIFKAPFKCVLIPSWHLCIEIGQMFRIGLTLLHFSSYRNIKRNLSSLDYFLPLNLNSSHFVFAGELHHFRPRRLRVHFKMFSVSFILPFPYFQAFGFRWEVKRETEEDVNRNSASKLKSNMSTIWVHSATFLVPHPKYVPDSFTDEMAAKMKSSVVFFRWPPRFGCINKTGKALASRPPLCLRKEMCPAGCVKRRKVGHLEFPTEIVYWLFKLLLLSYCFIVTYSSWYYLGYFRNCMYMY